MAASLALGAFGLGVAPAAAATITSSSATLGSGDVGTSFTVDFVCSAALPCSGTPYSVLGARATFELTGHTVSGNEVWWDFSLTIRNTSWIASTAFLTALGFASSPNSVMDGVWDANSDGVNWEGGAGFIPGFNGSNELCVWNGNGCAAANEHDLGPGDQDRLGFTLVTGLTSTLTLSDFAVKWAGNAVTRGSFEAGGSIRVAPVPLPATGGLLLLGLGGLALLRRGRKSA